MFQVPVGDDYQSVDPLNQIMQSYNNAMNAMHQQAAQKEAKQQADAVMASKLANTAAQTNLYGSQAGNQDSQGKLADAKVANIPIQNALDNLKIQSEFAKILASKGGSNSKLSQMTYFMRTPEGAKAVSDNPEMQKNILTMANQAAYEGANPDQSGLNVMPQLKQLQDMFPQSQTAPTDDKSSELKGISPAQNTAMSSQYTPSPNNDSYVDMRGNPVQVDKLSPQQQGALKLVNQAQIDGFKQAAADSFEKQTNTTNTLNQRKAVTNFINTMDKGNKYLPGYLRYVGAAKAAGLTLGKFESGAGKNNPDLNDYNNFKTTVLKDMSNEYRKIMAGNASDKEQALVDSIVNPDQWWANPEAAVSKLNSVYETVQGFSKSLMGSQSDTKKQLEDFANRKGDYYSASAVNQPNSQGTGGNMTVNPDQLQKAPAPAAQALGMSQQSSPSARTLPVPQFKSKEEAQSWFAKQPPKIRAYIIQQQGRQK